MLTHTLVKSFAAMLYTASEDQMDTAHPSLLETYPFLRVSTPLLSIGIAIVLVGFTHYLINRDKKFIFLDIARDTAGYPSLARFQFLAWTLVIIFAILAICLLRTFGNQPAIPGGQVPWNLLTLMGISVSVTPTSTYISHRKYGEPPKSGTEIDARVIQEERRTLPFGSMLTENGRPSLTRFQMFSWTIISITLFLGKVFTNLGKPTITEVIIPDVETVLVVLMGLSQGAYVGGKWLAPTTLKIKNRYPETVALDDELTITGLNFGNEKKDVLLNHKGTEIKIAENALLKWENNRIIVKMPVAITQKEDLQSIRVIVDNKEAQWTPS